MLIPTLGAFAVASAQPTFEQRCMCAVLGAGPEATLSHRTAAYLSNYDGFARPERIDVTISSQRRIGARPGMRVHYGALERGDRVLIRRLPVTSATRPERSML